ncbi:hypothetical protein CRUP_025142 [Coryphaenoides rupestris]|nr:hypothetical protein CRUP_025142 [Coryphaenoides rupestris]
MSFLTIPSEEGLFTTVKAEKWAEDEDAEEEEEDDGSGEVSFSLRSSPILRRRGHSIFDETAEYMRIHSSLPVVAKRRVWFADTTGGDLLDVREFVAFASDEDEDEDPGFEAEAACYRKHPTVQPTYRICTDFRVPAERSALLEAVQTHKVAVEQLSPVEGEPLAFSGLVRVLNISYHKAVYMRSTMDHWDTYYDQPAEYIRGSNDGQTDTFGFKLSFAPPYNTHGSRIEFVVRYETSVGDYWANNSHMNYAVTLLVSYEDDHVSQVNTDTRHNKLRGILKAPKVHSVDNDGEQRMDEEDLSSAASRSQPVRPTPVCPAIIHPRIDVETADDPFGPPLPLDREPSSLTHPRCDDASRPHRSPCTTSPHNTTDPPSHVHTSQVRPTRQSSESQSSPSLLPCERPPDDHRISERSEAPQPPATPSRPHAAPSPTPSAGSSAGGAVQGKESTALDKLRPLTVTQASVHVSHREIDEEEMLRLTLGDRRIKVAQIFPRGEKDLLNEKIEHPLNESVGRGGDVSSSTKEHFDPEFNECHSARGLQKEISPENTEGRLRSFETLARLNDLGVPVVPSAPGALSPTASVTLHEQPSHTSSTMQHLGPFETSTSSKVEDVDTAKAHSSRMSERLELTSAESEREEEVSVEGSREGRSDRSHDKERQTKTAHVYEEQGTLGDTTAAFSENGEMVHRGTTARPDIAESVTAAADAVHADNTSVTAAGGENAARDASARTRGETEVAAESPQSTSDALAARGGRPDTSRDAVEAPRSHAECRRYFRLGVVLLFGFVSVVVVMKEPGSLFYLGFFFAALFFLMTSD